MDKLNPSFPAHSLPPYPLGEVASSVREARRKGLDVIDFSQVNPSLGAPSVAIDALVEAALKDYNHSYSSSQGISRLRQAAASWYETRFDVSVCPDSEVVVCLGSKEGLAHLLLAITRSRDTVIVPTPSYPIHTAAVYIAGAGFIGVPIPQDEYSLTEDSAFFTQLECVYSRTWPRPTVCVISFPHNPTTCLATESFFKRLIAFAKKNSVYIIHDFAYADLCYSPYQAPSLLSVEGGSEVGVEFYSVSKGLNLAGWRVSFCVGNKELIKALKRIKSYLDFGIFQPIQIAVSKLLLDHPETAIAEIQNSAFVYSSRLDVLVEGLSQMGWNFTKPEASLFLWARLPESIRNRDSADFARSLMELSQVAVCPGSGFDQDSQEFVRFALMENEARIRIALKRMKSVL